MNYYVYLAQRVFFFFTSHRKFNGVHAVQWKALSCWVSSLTCTELLPLAVWESTVRQMQCIVLQVLLLAETFSFWLPISRPEFYFENYDWDQCLNTDTNVKSKTFACHRELINGKDKKKEKEKIKYLTHLVTFGEFQHRLLIIVFKSSWC